MVVDCSSGVANIIGEVGYNLVKISDGGDDQKQSGDIAHDPAGGDEHSRMTRMRVLHREVELTGPAWRRKIDRSAEALRVKPEIPHYNISRTRLCCWLVNQRWSGCVRPFFRAREAAHVAQEYIPCVELLDILERRTQPRLF
jgi:hypothetical protein